MSVIDLYTDELYHHGTACRCRYCRPLKDALAERDRARLTAATLANRLWQAERLLMTVIQPGTSHAQDEETGRLINIFLANGGNHHD